MTAADPIIEHLARLVGQLRTSGSRPDDVRETLRRLAAAARGRSVLWQCDGTCLQADGAPASGDAAAALAARMAAHGIRRLQVRQHATAAELLQCARLLAEEPTADAAAFERRVAALRLWQVTLSRSDEAEAEGSELGPSIPQHAPITRQLFRLRGAVTPVAVHEAQEAVVALQALAAEHEAAGDGPALSAVLVGLVRAEREAEADVLRVCVGRAIDALATPAVLRLVVRRLPAVAGDAAAYRALLQAIDRCGQPGGATLIAYLMAAEAREERRVYFDAIVQLRAGIPILIGALGHSQWYIVRNAACLLGEMEAEKADAALARLLDHPDERVREAATGALAKLDTRTARLALQQLLHDRSPRVRLHAVEAFARNREARIAAPLSVALDAEEDGDVQLGLLAGLGQIGTPDAVEKLVRAALPAGMRPRPATFRIAALEALVVARGRAAHATLRSVMEDDDPAVREAAQRLVAMVG